MTSNTPTLVLFFTYFRRLRAAMLVLVLCAACSMLASAQNGDPEGPRKERIERLKRAYITEKLDLSVPEAEKFWPLYNDYAQRREALRKDMKRLERAIANGEGDLQSAIDQLATKRIEEVKNDQQFAKDALPILGNQKTSRLLGLEQEFRREMMQRLKERRQQGR